MALKVWLPLNKDLRNIGLDNVSLTNYGVSLSDDGVFVKSHSFNGTSNYFQFDNLNIDSKRYLSLTFWCYSVNGDLYGVFVVRQNGSTHNFSLTRTGLGFRDTNHGSYTSLTFEQPSANVWTHYAIIYNDGTWIIYKNGVKICTQVYGSATLNTSLNEIRVGYYKSSSANYYFNGKLNDFRVYDHALTEEDVKRIYQKKIFDLVPYSGIKNVLFDRSGLMIGNVVPYNITYRPMCAYFNGSASAIQIPPMTSMNDSGIFSMNVWFYKDGFGSQSWETIFGGPNGFELEMKPRRENTPRIVAYSWGQTSATGITYATKQWNMLTMTRTTSNSKFYLNGELKYTGSAKSIPSGDYWVGSWLDSNSQNYKGLVGNFQLYRKELTAEEILKLYNTERNMFLPDEYEELEYIQANGTQYIDTGIFLSNNDKFEIKFQRLSTATTFVSIFGAIGGGTAYTSTSNFSITYVSNKYAIYCDGAAGNADYAWVGGNISDTKVYTISYKGLNIKPTINGSAMTQTASHTLTQNNPTKTSWLFGRNNTGSGNISNSQLNVFYLKMWNNGLLVRYFIPSKRKTDDVIGMYDMVTRQFFTNSGTGSFTGA